MMAALLLGLAIQPVEPDTGFMAGYWLSCEGGREVSETWTDPRAGQLIGYSVTLRGERLSWEFARIAPQDDGRLAFFAQPHNQPPHAFALVRHGPAELVFEDPQHDFPQRVIYRREGAVLIGRIEGVIDGTERAVEWRYEAAELNSRCPSGT